MKYALIKFDAPGGPIYDAMTMDKAHEMRRLMWDVGEWHSTIYEAGKVPFEVLPEDIQHRVRRTVEDFGESRVCFADDEFDVTALIGHNVVCGRYTKEDIQ